MWPKALYKLGTTKERYNFRCFFYLCGPRHINLFYLEKKSVLIINIFKTNIFRIQLTFGVVNDLT